jgi:hypothetical protein
MVISGRGGAWLLVAVALLTIVTSIHNEKSVRKQTEKQMQRVVVRKNSSTPTLVLIGNITTKKLAVADSNEGSPGGGTTTGVNLTLPFLPKASKYVRAKEDRAGSAISEMLKAHAYSFNHQIELLGFCMSGVHVDQNKKLVKAIGLDQVFKLGCPSNIQDIPTKGEEYQKHFVPRKDYRNDEENTFTPAWLDYMTRAYRPRNLPHYSDGIFRIAVHIRRGDVSLCTPNAKKRYLNNMHYIRIIDRVLERYIVEGYDVRHNNNNSSGSSSSNRPYQVTIYSESHHHNSKTKTQYEDFAEFEERGYTLRLDYGIQPTWLEFIAADVLITAKSGFSMLAALLRLNKPGVIFTPHPHAYMLPHWELVEESFMQQTALEMKVMQIQKCPQNGTEIYDFNNPMTDYDRHYYHHPADDNRTVLL